MIIKLKAPGAQGEGGGGGGLRYHQIENLFVLFMNLIVARRILLLSEILKEG